MRYHVKVIMSPHTISFYSFLIFVLYFVYTYKVGLFSSHQELLSFRIGTKHTLSQEPDHPDSRFSIHHLKVNSKMIEDKFSPPPGLEQESPGTESQCATAICKIVSSKCLVRFVSCMQLKE